MSNAVRWDPPLARAVAHELDARLRGRRAAPLPRFSAGGSVTLWLDGGEALRFDLAPNRGWVRVLPEAPPTGTAASARIERVFAPPDERVIVIALRERGSFGEAARRLVVEFIARRWNALLVDATTSRIVAALRRPAPDPGSSASVYQPLPRAPRLGAAERGQEMWDRWCAELGAAPLEHRRDVYLRNFADASALNAAWVLGDVVRRTEGSALRAAFARWQRLVDDEPAPCLRGAAGALQPYPLRFDTADERPAPSLLAAMEIIATEAAPRAGAAALNEAERARRRAARLRAQLARATEAAAVRERADHLLAFLHLVPPGASVVRLPRFSGEGEIEVALDPALAPARNAERLYRDAARLERAAARLPAMIAEAEAEAVRYEAAAVVSPSDDAPPRASRAVSLPPRTGAAAPYRVYRSSGGLEIRVGRGARHNDVLTFHHASPDDVWLHARGAAGAHVVLRWTDRDQAPPQRDLHEAAVLAALHSRARTAGTVAVDWTRRKHVRKPRGAPRGAVTLTQARTLFVAPDEALEQQLRVDSAALSSATEPPARRTHGASRFRKAP